MSEEIPYEYIFLNMFNNLAKFSDKKSVTKDQAYKYYEKVLEEAKDNAKELGYNSIEFEETDFYEELDSFLEEYSEYFYSDRNNLYIEDDVDMEEIDDTIVDMFFNDEVSKIFLVSFDSIEFLSIIGSTYMHNEFKRLLDYEYQYEKIYEDFIINPTTDKLKRLKTLSFMSALQFVNINNLSSYKISALHSTSFDFMSGNKHEYKEEPINKGLWDSISHPNSTPDYAIFHNDYQDAIFGDQPMAYYKLDDRFEKLYKKTNFDDYSIGKQLLTNFDIESRRDRAFFFKYLNNINEYALKYGMSEDLLKSKARLMYYMDTDDNCLYMNQDNDKEMIDNANLEMSSKYIPKIADEVYFFVVELFASNKVAKKEQKLILIKTYYDVTHDKELLDLFEAYSEQPYFEEYKEIIFGKNKTLAL